MVNEMRKCVYNTNMKLALSHMTTTAILLLLPISQAHAVDTTLSVSGLYAGGISWTQVIANIIGTLSVTIFAVSAAAFMIGSLMYISGFISEENKNKGKNLMIGALFGMAIVLSAKAIFNTAYFFVYGN